MTNTKSDSGAVGQHKQAAVSTLHLIAALETGLPEGPVPREFVDGLLLMIAASLRAGFPETRDDLR